MLTRREIEDVVLSAMTLTNKARAADQQLTVSGDAPLFGPDSRLDSLGLVGLLVDIEDALSDAGVDVQLSDARAMSSTRSPFRSVPALVDYIADLLTAEA